MYAKALGSQSLVYHISSWIWDNPAIIGDLVSKTFVFGKSQKLKLSHEGRIAS